MHKDVKVLMELAQQASIAMDRGNAEMADRLMQLYWTQLKKLKVGGL